MPAIMSLICLAESSAWPVDSFISCTTSIFCSSLVRWSVMSLRLVNLASSALSWPARAVACEGIFTLFCCSFLPGLGVLDLGFRAASSGLVSAAAA